MEISLSQFETTSQRIGIAIWHLQELEGSAARFLVLEKEITAQTNWRRGEELVTRAMGRTFGATLRELANANLLTMELQCRLKWLVSERNWLVHKSLASSRYIIEHSLPVLLLTERVDKIVTDTLSMDSAIKSLLDEALAKYGIDAETFEKTARELLFDWSTKRVI